ncbi:VPA1269 family protein [Donghicola tyrosinivorans]|uniref:VPA1269 family protein n=1 Tax=Donghicola tyrosinivorans TaxID=1652492 RepID=UPI003CCBEFB1
MPRPPLKVDGQFNFYVNTNKTADAKTGFDEFSGYYVPFQHSPLIELFDKLRHWQEKYNPVSGPTPVSACKNEVGMGSAAERVFRYIQSASTFSGTYRVRRIRSRLLLKIEFTLFGDC